MPAHLETKVAFREAATLQPRAAAPNHSDHLLSIVVSSFNYGRYLNACIDSALGQTYPLTEVIVVDDGSTDDSPAILDAYGDRIRAIRQPNAGQAAAMSRGYAASRGEVVIFLDADDVLLPTTAERVIAALNRQPDLAKIEYPLAIIDAAGERTGQIIPPAHVPRASGDVRCYELTAPFDMVWMGPSGTAYSRRVLERVMPVPPPFASRGADWYLAHVSALHGPVLFLADVGGCYRVHGANAFAGSDLDLQRVALAVDVMRRTGEAIRQVAQDLGLLPSGRRAPELLSFSYVAHRIILARLAPHLTPGRPDAVPHLVWLGLLSLHRRQDISIMLKAIMALWLLAMAAAPGSSADWLARSMLVAEQRPRSINRLLGIAHCWHARARRVAGRGRAARRLGAAVVRAERG